LVAQLSVTTSHPAKLTTCLGRGPAAGAGLRAAVGLSEGGFKTA
jgi:hypothetical protein